MSPLRLLRGFVFGGLGGVLAWAMVEFLPPPFPSPPFRPTLFESLPTLPPSTPQTEGLLGIALGLGIGGFLGLSEGMAEGTTARFRRAFLSFLLLGAVGGFLGLYFGQFLFTMLGGRSGAPSTAVQFFQGLLARTLGWTLIGLFLGVIFGVPNLSARRMWNGAVGGAIGGFLGGFLFQTLTSGGIGAFQGMHGRLVGFTLLGALIGFFINLIAEVMKRVWVKVLTGRNEGREHVIDQPVAYVGRDELADIPVFLDPAVPRRMASFRLMDGRYALHPESDALQVMVNSEPLVPGRILRDGDAIQFGRVTLAYYEKATVTGLARPSDSIGLADPGVPSVLPGATPIPSVRGVCPYCGQRQDPATGACACSVAGAAPAQSEQYAAAWDPAGYQDATVAYAPTIAPAAPDYGAGYQAVSAPSMGGPRLVGIAGPYQGLSFPLTTSELGVGRDPSQEIALTGDSTASRRHARFFAVQGGWMLRDEGSSNGTFVNGVRVHEQPLFPGDEIRIGQSQFRFEA